MQFINFLMLFGLLGVAVPIIIQILTRKNAQRIRWGAWLFLDKTMHKRKRKVLLEDILLLASRCLAVGLLALAFARPFVRPDSPVPWAVTMPVLLVAITAVGISFALWRYPKQRRIMFYGGIALFVLAIASIVFERQLNLKRFGLGATKDVVIIVDGSASMSILNDGKSNFERAIEESKKYVEQAPRNTSFSVIIGGPVPQVMNPVPIADKRVILNTLERIQPANGTMAIAGNLTAAAVTLASGRNAVKQIVIVGDGQTVGWQLEDRERWKTLARVFASLKTQPIITWRTLPLPTSIRNLAIAGIRPWRDVVGTDREVAMDVTVVNAGTESVTPKGLTFTVEGQTMRANEVHQLEPGESQTFTFKHQFKSVGGTMAVAHVEATDDLPMDDTYKYAMPIVDKLRVLVIDGEPGQDFLSRASTYVRLALRPELVKAASEATDAPKKDYLLDTTVEDVTTVAARTSFGGYAAIVMMGVRKLPEQTLDRIASFVEAGGGLFVMPGMATDASAFNAWTHLGDRVLPAPLGKWRKNEAELDTSSFREMLQRFRTGSDLNSVVPERIMDFGEGYASNALAVAKLKDGSAFILTRRLGRGTVMESAVNFDVASGLVSKRGFVPMLHELAYSLARPAAVALDIRPAEGISLLVATGAAGGESASDHGLIGYYYPQPNFKGKPFVRVDKNIAFEWSNNRPIKDNAAIPEDNFSVRWRGVLQPKASGVYKIFWDVDDRLAVKIGGKDVRHWGSVRLEAGKPYPLVAQFEEDTGRAAVWLKWQRPDGKHEVVPQEMFLTQAAGCEGAGTVVEVRDPHGETFYAEIYYADAGMFLRITRSVIPGVYTVDIPNDLREEMKSSINSEGKLRFTVSSGVEESTLSAITQSQLSDLCNYVQISQAIKEEDVIKAIGGQSFGKEVWRILAFIAFLFLVAEPAIARWIAINRRTGDVLDTEEAWIKT